MLNFSLTQKQKLDDCINLITSFLENELSEERQRSIPYQVWSIAQIIKSTTNNKSINQLEIIKFFNSRMQPNHNCWQEYYTDDSPSHLAASAWVLLALKTDRKSVV